VSARSSHTHRRTHDVGNQNPAEITTKDPPSETGILAALIAERRHNKERMTRTSESWPASHESSDTLERDAALDGVRGLALSMVVLGHGFDFATQGPMTRAMHTLMDSMQVGLDLFFVLSGFFISSILIRTRDDERYFVNFYERRVLRIFLAYYLLLLAVYIGRPLLFGEPLAVSGGQGAAR
jgi:hypothetical protein